ncbi:MAG: hypothetical protein ACR2QW_13525 [bacterium]
MECDFCFPVKVNMQHKDYLKRVLISLHCASVFLIYVIAGLHPALIVSGICAVSLKYYLEQQRSLCNYMVLYGFDLDDWRLERRSAESSVVKLDGLLLFGPFLLIRLKRYGGSMAWLTSVSHQNPVHWHKIRVLENFQ